MDERYWLAAYIGGKNEIKFAEELNEKGVEAYVPLGKKHVRPHRKRKELTVIDSVAFPSYAFINLMFNSGNINGTQWGIVRDGPGFLYVVSEVAGQPLAVPSKDIDFIKEMERRGAFDDRSAMLSFVVGDEIEVMEGPFKWRRGKVLVESDREPLVELGNLKVKINVSLMRFFRQSPHPGRSP